MKRTAPALSLLTLLAGACASNRPAPPLPLGFEEVEIVRDTWGVPHVYGPTDPAVVFGLAYAQAEDGLAQIEDNFLAGLGRASERWGEESFTEDFLARALELPRLAREEYERSSPRMRALYDAYAAGLNHYSDSHGHGEGALLEHFEPWHTLAFLRFKYYVQEFVGYAGVRRDEIEPAAWEVAALERSRTRVAEVAAWTEPARGSNAWAITPAKSSTGNAMLFVNPHVGFYGPGIYYESHLVSDEGWNFSGVGRYGFPWPYMGHNAHLGWGHTDNYHDHGDLYLETFDRPADPLAYRYGDGYRQAVEWEETIRVRARAARPWQEEPLDDSPVEERRVTFRRTHHGPILLARDGRPVAVRLAKLAEGGWYDQHHAMTRATTLDEFREALARGAIPYMNVTYADAAGHAYYVYNGVVPRRSLDFDWHEPVEGSDPRTEWQGFHGFGELPQLLDPQSGFVLNTNSTPFTASTTDAPRRADFPAYMIGPETDNARAQVSREILTEQERFDFESWSRATLDTRVLLAREWLAAVLEAYELVEELDPERADSLADTIEDLARWDCVSSVDSTEMTLFVLSRETGHAPIEALEAALEKLEREWGRSDVPWGELNRLQHRHWSGQEPFDDDAPSVAVPGGPGYLGMAFVFTAPQPDGLRRRYGRHGNSYVSVVEFGDPVRARSVVFFGQSLDPDSPHSFDQAPVYGSARYRPSWFARADVEAHAERRYRPAEGF